MRPRFAARLVLLTLLASSCAYRGGSDVVTTRVTWFSYLNGDDIRERCMAGGPPLYRFVYNGDYTRQVRTYAIAPAGGGGWVLRTRVMSGPLITEIVIDDPVTTLGADPLSVFESLGGVRASATLTGRDIDDLDKALATSGFFRPAPRGLRLPSDDFYWIAIACIDGRVTFNAFLWPSPRFDALTFPSLLFGWDPTGVPVDPPRQRAFGGLDQQDPGVRNAVRFTLTIGENGLAGHHTLF